MDGAMAMTLGVGGGGDTIAFFSLAGLSALVTLAALEIVLGIDNIVFIAILTGRLPEERQALGRRLGLILAGVMRLILLALAWLVTRLQAPLFTLPFFEEEVTNPETGAKVTQGIGISGQDLVLLLGGLFLIAKATWEIHHMVEDGAAKTSEEMAGQRRGGRAGLWSVVGQILLLDIVFSLDSVITAVGMTSNYWVMASAVVLSVGVMLTMAGPVGRFVASRPTMKTLALAFLVLIGVLLVADGLHQHLDRGYVYFAMGFSLVVELINMRVGGRRKARADSAGGA
ncbi:MAG: TerC family protein [Phycisphaerales bacterium]